jgi:hypothetical protein
MPELNHNLTGYGTDGNITGAFVDDRRKAMNKEFGGCSLGKIFLLVNGKFLVSVFTDRNTATSHGSTCDSLYCGLESGRGFPKREVLKTRGKPL